MKKCSHLFLIFLISFLLAGCGAGAPQVPGGSRTEPAEYGSESMEDEAEPSGGLDASSPPDSAERKELSDQKEISDSAEPDLPAELSDPAEPPDSAELSDPAEPPDSAELSDPAQPPDSAELSDPAQPSSSVETSAPTEPPVPAEQPALTESPATAETVLPEDGTYCSKEEVAEYLVVYGHLPPNYITKKEAEKLGWKGGSLEPFAPGKCIGGSYFGNYEGRLPEKKGRVYTECDIDTLGAEKRGAKRIVFSNDGLIYYTEDHYSTFELLYGEEE